MREINIPIHKHTPKRYRQSRNELNVGLFSSYPAIKRGVSYLSIPLVTDLQRVPLNLSANKVWGDDSEIKYVNTDVRFMSSLDPFFNDLADKFRESGFEPYPTKKLGIFQNIWNKIKKLRRK